MSFGYIPGNSVWKNIILRITGWPNVIRRLQAPVIMKMLNPGKDNVILDAGCGEGCFSFEISKRCKKSVGVDLNVNKKGISDGNYSNLTLVRGDIQKLPFENESFDKILLSSVLQMVADDCVVLTECHRVLNKGGELVLSVPVEYIWITSLNQIKKQLKTRFRANGKGYYKPTEIFGLLNAHGYRIVQTEYAPKKWGSLICEIWLFITYHLKLPLFSPYYFFFLYPVCLLERIIGSKKQNGNEIVIKVVKTGVPKERID